MPSQKVKAVGAQYPYGEPRISLDTYAGAEEHLLQVYQKKRRADAQRPLREMLCWLRIYGRGGMLWKGGVPYIFF